MYVSLVSKSNSRNDEDMAPGGMPGRYYECPLDLYFTFTNLACTLPSSILNSNSNLPLQFDMHRPEKKSLNLPPNGMSKVGNFPSSLP
jgi:hypothetical protein